MSDDIGKQLTARCWNDGSFKQRLLSDPVATLKAEGVSVPARTSIQTLENTEKLFHICLPTKKDGERSRGALTEMATYLFLSRGTIPPGPAGLMDKEQMMELLRTAGKIRNQLKDSDEKQKLLANPAATLDALGIQIPDGVTVKVVENTDKLFHLVIPSMGDNQHVLLRELAIGFVMRF